MPKVTFLPSGIGSEVETGTTLMEAACQVGVKIATTCGGKASCRLCKVRIVEGAEALSAMGFAEQNALGNVFFITRERLSCQTRLSGDCTVEVPDAITPAAKKPLRLNRPAR